MKTQDDDRYTKYQPISGMEAISSGDIRTVFPEAHRSGSLLMSEELAKDLRGWLVEPDFAATQRTPLILDSRQRALAEPPPASGDRTRYRRIKGPAGSGKSLVLAARAARLANEGKTVLVATFNITLWHYLRDLIVRALDGPEKIKNIQFTHFHLLCKHACYEIGWEGRYDALWAKRDVGEHKDILNLELPLLASEALKQPGAMKYDAILVDEGQDYRPLWWNVLREACVAGGEMLLVADATQDIYGTATAWTDEAMTGAGFQGRWAQLGISYRLPPDALTLARKFAEIFLPEASVDLPQPEQGSLDLYPCHLRWVQCVSDEAEKACSDEIQALMRQTGENGLANSDITVLTSDMAAGSTVVRLLGEYGLRTVDTFGSDHRRRKMGFYMGDARIKATTLHSFKGWEARLLVVYVTEATNPQSLALIYAGLTRLKRSKAGSWLTVVCSAPELSDFGKAWDDYRELSKQRLPDKGHLAL